MVNANARELLYEQLAAKAVIGEHRRKAFETAFSGTYLRKKRTSILEDVAGLAEGSLEFGSTVAEAAGQTLPEVLSALPIGAALDAVLKIIGIEEGEMEDFNGIMAEELAVFASNSVLSIASLYTPYLSTVFAGKDMIKQWVNVAVEGHKAYTQKRTIPCDLLPGDAQAAGKAVRQLIVRNRNNSARLATINMVKFSVDVAATAGGFGAGGAAAGPITGAAAAGAKLANSLYLMGLDYHEMKGANDLLKSNTLPSAEKLFGVYPLLGCYLIAGADDSDLLFFFMPEMGQKGWMDKIEEQKKRTLGPLQDEARRYINDSRFELNGFNGSKINIIIPQKKSKFVHMKSWAQRVFY